MSNILSYEKNFIIHIIDENDTPPTDIILSNSEINENSNINTIIGTFTSIGDQDLSSIYSYNIIDVSNNVYNYSYQYLNEITTDDFKLENNINNYTTPQNNDPRTFEFKFKVRDGDLSNMLTQDYYFFRTGRSTYGDFVLLLNNGKLKIFTGNQLEDPDSNDQWTWVGAGIYNPIITINDVSGGIIINDENWHHIIFSYSGENTTNNINIIIDGIKYQETITWELHTNNNITSFHNLNVKEYRSYNYFTNEISELYSLKINNDKLITNKLINNYEANGSYNITVSSSDGIFTISKNFTINIDLNEPPFDIILSNTNVDENVSIGTIVATLSSSDPDVSNSFTYTLSGTDASSFTIDGDTLKTNTTINYEVKNSYNVTITTSDGEFTYNKNFTINVNNINDVPIDISLFHPTGFMPFHNRNYYDHGNVYNFDDGFYINSIVGVLYTHDDDLLYNPNETYRTSSQGNLKHSFIDNGWWIGWQIPTFDVSGQRISLDDNNGLDGYTSGDIYTTYSTIDLQQETMVYGIVTQGVRWTYSYCTSYRIRVSNDDISYSDVIVPLVQYDTVNNNNKFIGNTDTGSKVESYFNQPVTARYVRIYPVLFANQRGGGLRHSMRYAILLSNTNNNSIYSYTLSGTDASSFILDGDTLKTNTVIDYETKNIYNFTITTSDGELTYSKDFTFNVNLVVTPTDITLSNTSIDENNSIGTVIGIMNIVTASSRKDTRYRLSGIDASSFSIKNNNLKAGTIFDYETKNSYDITITAIPHTDMGMWGDEGNYDELAFSKDFTISINNINEAPTDITLSTTSIDENVSIGTIVGTLSSVDQDSGDTFTYTLTGTDASSFLIDGSNLKTNIILNYEVKNSYDITVTTSDGEFTYNKDFTINVNNINEAPTDITLSNNIVDENVSIGTIVGTLSSVDEDSGDTFTYTLTGTDASSFLIDGSNLKTNIILNYEVKNSYDITVTTSDGELTYSKGFTINVNNINEAPTDITLSNNIVDENVSIGTIVGTLSSVDEDSGDTFTYTLTGTDASSFLIDGSNLKTNIILNYEVKNSYDITVTTSDGELTYSKDFTISINNINVAPTDITLFHPTNFIPSWPPSLYPHGNTNNINENVAINSIVGVLYTHDADSLYNPDETYRTYTHSAGSVSRIDFHGYWGWVHNDDYTVPDDNNGLDGYTSGTDITAYSTIDLQQEIMVFGVVTQGLRWAYSYCNSYRIRVSNDNITYSDVIIPLVQYDTVNNNNKFIGNTDTGSKVESYFNQPVTARYVRIYPTEFGQNSTHAPRHGMRYAILLSNTSYSYTLSGTDASYFILDGDTLKTNTVIDYETKNIYNFTITTSDGELTYSKDFTFNVNDINEAPTDITLSNTSVDENVSIGTIVGTLSSSDPDVSNSFTYTLTGTDTSSFLIDGSNLKTNIILNYEVKNSYDITVTISDGELAFSKDFTINVNNINVAPIDISFYHPTNNMPTPYVSSPYHVDENVAINSIVGVLYTHDDDSLYNPDETYRTYSPAENVNNPQSEIDPISHHNAGWSSGHQFNSDGTYNSWSKIYPDDNNGLDGYTSGGIDTYYSTIDLQQETIVFGVVTSGTKNHYTWCNSYRIRVSNDNITYSDVIVPLLQYDAVNNNNKFIGNTDTNSKVESFFNQPVTARYVRIYPTEYTKKTTMRYAILLSNTSYSYTLSGTDASSFILDGDTLKTNTVIDYETKNSYDITITTSDGELTYSKDFTINVNNINEAPTDITLSNNIVDENVSIGTIVATLSSSDPDVSNSFTYTLTGTDASSFTIDGSNLKTNIILNYEVKNSYDITITTSDGELTFSKDFTINVNNINVAPTDITLFHPTNFMPSTSGLYSVDENVSINSIVGVLYTHDDDSLYNLGDSYRTYTHVNGGRHARIDDGGSWGWVHEFSRTVPDDNNGLDGYTSGDINTAYSTIDLQQETMVFGVVTQGIRWVYSYCNSYRIRVSNDNITYSDVIVPLVQYDTVNNNNKFIANTDSGSKVESYFNQPVTARYVRIYPTEFGIGLTWAGGTGYHQMHAMRYAILLSNTSYSYTLSGTDASSFILDGDTLKTNTAFDYETKNSYDITITTSDGELTYSKNFTINVTVADNNTAPTNISLSSTSINENSSSGTTIGTVSSSDAEGNALTYTLSGTDSSSFTLTGTTLKSAAIFDYETKSSYSITITVSDGSLSSSSNFTINVNNIINVAPKNITLFHPTASMPTTTGIYSVNENVSINTTVGVLYAHDDDSLYNPDEHYRTYSPTPSGASKQSRIDLVGHYGWTLTNTLIDGNNGLGGYTSGSQWTPYSTIDLQQQTMVFGVVTTGRKQHGKWVKSYRIRVSNDNIAYSDVIVPLVKYSTSSNSKFIGNTDTNSKVESYFNQPVKTRYVRIYPVDHNGAISMRYAILLSNTSYSYTLSGTDASSFILDGDTLKTNTVIDYETKNSYDITITTSDGELTYSKDFTINVNNIYALTTNIMDMSFLSNISNISFTPNLQKNHETLKINLSSLNDGSITCSIINNRTTNYCYSYLKNKSYIDKVLIKDNKFIINGLTNNSTYYICIWNNESMEYSNQIKITLITPIIEYKYNYNNSIELYGVKENNYITIPNNCIIKNNFYLYDEKIKKFNNIDNIIENIIPNKNYKIKNKNEIIIDNRLVCVNKEKIISIDIPYITKIKIKWCCSNYLKSKLHNAYGKIKLYNYIDNINIDSSEEKGICIGHNNNINEITPKGEENKWFEEILYINKKSNIKITHICFEITDPGLLTLNSDSGFKIKIGKIYYSDNYEKDVDIELYSCKLDNKGEIIGKKENLNGLNIFKNQDKYEIYFKKNEYKYFKINTIDII